MLLKRQLTFSELCGIISLKIELFRLKFMGVLMKISLPMHLICGALLHCFMPQKTVLLLRTSCIEYFLWVTVTQKRLKPACLCIDFLSPDIWGGGHPVQSFLIFGGVGESPVQSLAGQTE